ncbi:MAG: hypothetical protein LLG20_17880 [Acidobacteriales bacterium]|nr:hypothetical protein [Terriglobales bacterium]
MGFLVGGALIALYFIWAAGHDISRGDESNYTLEYIFLALGAAGLFFIHRQAMRILTFKARRAWLWITIGLIALSDVAALSTRLHPKYPNDAVVGTAFLAVTLPVLGLLCRRAICPRCQRQSSCQS